MRDWVPRAQVAGAAMIPPVPITFGATMAVGVVLHVLAVYAVLGFADPLSGALSFLLGQAAISLGLLRGASGAWVGQDIRFLFVICYVLYGGTRAIAVLVGAVEPDAMLSDAVFLYGSGLVAFNLVQWAFREPWPAARMADACDERTGPLTPLVALAAVAACYGYAAARGVAFGLSVDRERVGLVYTQFWIVLNLVTAGVLMHSAAAWRARATLSRLAIAGAVVAYVLLHLTFGNRREFLPLLLAIFAMVACRRRLTIGIGQVTAGLLAFFVLLGLGVARQILIDPTLLLGEPLAVFFAANEFVSPIVTLVHYLSAEPDLLWGGTYLSWVAIFVPRALWPDKPESAGRQFVLDAFGTTDYMGFAYTPVTEAVRNFGWVGPFVMMLFLSVGMVYLVRRAPLWPRLYLVLFSLTLDWNRGDVPTTFYSTTILLFGYYVGVWLGAMGVARSAAASVPARAS